MATASELVKQGLTSHRAGDLAQAEQLYRQALALDPNHPDAHHFLGTLAHQCGQEELAIQLLQRAFELKQSPRTLNNLGETYRALDRTEEAIRCFRTAIAMTPTYGEAHQNLGVALAHQMKLDAALASYANAIEIDPDNAEAHVNRALVWLGQGKFDIGWPEYEWRHKRAEYRRPLAEPKWDGSALSGRTLLLWAEQGFGDTIQFARYIPQVVKRASGRIIFECQREVRPMLRDLAGVEMISQGDPLPPFDVQCALMSLPLIFRTTVNTIPRSIPYVTPLPQRVAKWRERIGDSTARKIGLAWSSNALNPSAKRRSCRLEDFAPLGAIPGVQFYSLQKGPAAAETALPPAGVSITDFTSDLEDFADTAALIANLDLVITVDTAVAHVAGAIGKPVWVLLPVASDWRWLLNREDSPWYPTARLFRQNSFNEWSEVMARVAKSLASAI